MCREVQKEAIYRNEGGSTWKMNQGARERGTCVERGGVKERISRL